MGTERLDLGLTRRLSQDRHIVEQGGSASSFVMPAVVSSLRPRGNPRWVNPSSLAVVPPQPSGWDRLLYRLNLKKDVDALEALQSGGVIAQQIAMWVRENRNRFIPESVLKEMGLDIPLP